MTVLNILTAALLCGCSTASSDILLLVGTYTDTDSRGIYSFSINPNTGISKPLSVTDIANPSFLCGPSVFQTIYSVTEQDTGASVSAYSLDRIHGTLTLINRKATHGGGSCHVSCIGKNVIASNYSSGSLSIFPLTEDGSLEDAHLLEYDESGPDTLRQQTSHIHSSGLSPDGNFLFVADLGGDYLYRFPVSNGQVTDYEPVKLKMPPGSGPRHFTFSDDGRFLYVLGEMGGAVTVYGYEDGALIRIQEIEADSLHAAGSADIHISPDGRFLYASHRLKGDGISIFNRNPETGILIRVGYQTTGVHPRNFAITPDGRLLVVACRDSDVIQVYRRNTDTGLLTDTGHDIKVPRPVCVIPLQ